MRRLTGVLAMAILLTVCAGSIFAYEGHKMHRSKEEKATMMYPMGGMMKMMMGKNMVATSDGGVVVMMGNKLIKYDKNLNLKKEVEVKLDMEAMQKMMQQMKEKCPMSRMMQTEQEKATEAAE